jgi:large subunit ribosomal protein L46
LNERLVLPFTQYFYFKRGTPAFEHWRAKRRERNNTAARDIGNYNPYKPDGWNDEALVGDDVGEPDQVVKRLLEDEGKDVAESIDAETAAQSQLGGLRRKTKADENNDQRSLERSLDRTLYLVVKKPSSGKAQRWEFPSGAIEAQEGVKEVCEAKQLLVSLLKV